MASERASQQAFLGVSTLLFAASALVTIVWCASMSAMGRDADARRLDDVDGVDAVARTDTLATGPARLPGTLGNIPG
jgi:hypothetical protein